MTFSKPFEEQLTSEEKIFLQRLDTPLKIQEFLDSVQYPSGEHNRSVLNVLRKRHAHCLDGGLFGAAALGWLGFEPVILDILPEPGTDDDHILALYKVDGCWGAVAKSNFVGLRFREPIYRTLRELVLSYFESYFNVDGLKTMRAYTRPIHLRRWDRLNWLIEDHGVDVIEKDLKGMKTTPIITPAMAARLNKADELTYKSGLGVANFDGLYKPVNREQ
jgi:hypothetical protein